MPFASKMAMRRPACALVLILGCAADPASNSAPSSDAADAGDGDAVKAASDTDTRDTAVPPCSFVEGQACSTVGRVSQCFCGGFDWKAVCCKGGRIAITTCADGVHLSMMCGPADAGEIADGDAAEDASADGS